MYSSLIGKIQKAKQYAQEPDRVRFRQFKISFQGDNDAHEIHYFNGRWHCSCDFFAGWGLCCHTMAVEELLGVMVPEKQVYPDALRGERTGPAAASG